MNEAAKIRTRLTCEGLWERIARGRGLDIGAGATPVAEGCDRWDLPEGDAQALEGVADESYDWVFSAHCLEHLRNPGAALHRWWAVLKPGGWLVVQVPDEDLYEHGIWPSVYNPDHKFTFTVSKARSWSPVSVSLASLIGALPDRKVWAIRTVDTGWGADKGDADQTLGTAEAGVEAIVQKLPRELPALRSQLARTVRCAACGWGRLGVEGVLADGQLALMCPRCGARAAMSVGAVTFTP